MRTFNIKNFILSVSTFYFLLSTFYFADAQSLPQFIVSWQAQNYAPSWYQGKIFPTNGTPVEISFELIDNGKVADLSKTKVRWYVNDKLVLNENSGLGIKNLKVTISDYAGQETEMRISLVDYLAGGQLDKIIGIPIVGPEVIINAPYFNKEIAAGPSIFQVIPFFFNVNSIDSLSAEWSVNDQKPTGQINNPFLFNLNIDTGTPKNTQINVSVSAENLLKEMEFATKSINLIIK